MRTELDKNFNQLITFDGYSTLNFTNCLLLLFDSLFVLIIYIKSLHLNYKSYYNNIKQRLFQDILFKKVLVDCKPEVKKRERKIAVYHKRCTFKLSQDLFNIIYSQNMSILY